MNINNKPSWSTAPEWAKYLAMDKSGEWYWYEKKPHCGSVGWYSSGGKSKPALDCWDESLEERE